MPRGTPEATFAEARGAMERGDWDGVFACLDRADVARVARNTFARLLMTRGPAADAFLQICDEHGPGEAIVRDLRAQLQRMAERGQAVAANRDPAAMLEASQRHQQLVKAYQLAVGQALKAVSDLPRFAAAMERAVRADGSGGSVSSRLFVGEALDGVSVDGATAWGTRRMAGGASEDVGFVRRKAGWYIRLLARRR